MTCEGHRQRSRAWVLRALLLAVVPAATTGTTFLPTLYRFDVPRSDARSLERAACGALELRLHTSVGYDLDEDRKEYSAHVRCSSHRSIEGQPVVYERSCTRKNGWNCEWAKEVITATFVDRRVNVTSRDGDLEHAYTIVKHFVDRKLIEPLSIDPTDDDRHPLPLDECEVGLALQSSYSADIHSHSGSQYALTCRAGRRQVLRTRSGNEVRYRQIPLPGCAAHENPECIAEKE